MATRVRLQRHGKKGKPVYHIVAADSRAKRDGKFIQKIGIYNPNTNPATIDINFEVALKWVQVGAELTDTARAILSYKGVLHKNHLLNGVKKGALTAEQAEAKFQAWLDEKEGKIESKKSGLSKSKVDAKAAALAAETAVKEAKAAAIEAKNTPAVEEAPAEEVEAATEEVATEEPAAEDNAEETPEA